MSLIDNTLCVFALGLCVLLLVPHAVFSAALDAANSAVINDTAHAPIAKLNSGKGVYYNNNDYGNEERNGYRKSPNGYYGPPRNGYGYGGSYENNEGGYGGGYGKDGSYENGGGYGSPNNGYGGNSYEQPQNGYGNEAPRGYGKGYGGSEYGKKTAYGPFFFHKNHHSYDSHYCSVHGSFSLAFSQQETAGIDQTAEKPSVPTLAGFEAPKKSPQKPRFHTRQYCRYAAAISEKSCQFCCRVVARSSNTSPDNIIAAIFSFDPETPTANGAGFESLTKDQKPGDGVTTTNFESKYQCVCCAPKHQY